MRKKLYIYVFTFLLLDIISKLIVKNTMLLNDSITVINNFFYITYVENTGAAFSILSGKQLFLIILGIVILFFIIKHINKDKLNNYKVIYYSLLISGIIGNIIDRIIYNGVIDFLDFKLWNYDAPIFNLADTFICISVMLIIFESIKDSLYENRSKRK